MSAHRTTRRLDSRLLRFAHSSPGRASGRTRTPEITASLENTNALVIEAAPGAGKTTRVPVAMDRPEVTGGRMVVVLQPRRAAARRIAWENGWRLGDEVGSTRPSLFCHLGPTC